MSRSLDFPVFDADNHMYETTDAFTKYLPESHKNLVRYVTLENGRTKIALRNVISDYIPNPTFNVVAPPGAQELEFKLKNPASKTESQPGDLELVEPPRYIKSPAAYFNPADRLDLMDELKIDRAMMWPTLASLLEERLSDDPEATHIVVHALNEWMHEHWTYNFEGRIFATPVITLPILDKAIEELDYVVERGARAILVRPAPVPALNGSRRSFALEEFDPFWKRVEEAGVLVGMHSSDDGAQRYMNDWEGVAQEFMPFQSHRSAFNEIVQHEFRTIKDCMTSIITHGLATRFPKLRFMPVENGSSWMRPMVHNLETYYERMPHLFDEDPMVVFHRSIFVHPFHEENVVNLVDIIGADNVVFGSDYPHPEGMFDPVRFIDEIDELPLEDQRKIMGGTLATLMGVDPLAKAV